MNGKRSTFNVQRPMIGRDVSPKRPTNFDGRLGDPSLPSQKHLSHGNGGCCRLRSGRCVKSVAGDAFGDGFALRAVTGHTVCFRGHEHITGVATLHGVMAIVAFYVGMLSVIEI